MPIKIAVVNYIHEIQFAVSTNAKEKGLNNLSASLSLWLLGQVSQFW